MERWLNGTKKQLEWERERNKWESKRVNSATVWMLLLWNLLCISVGDEEEKESEDIKTDSQRKTEKGKEGEKWQTVTEREKEKRDRRSRGVSRGWPGVARATPGIWLATPGATPYAKLWLAICPRRRERLNCVTTELSFSTDKKTSRRHQEIAATRSWKMWVARIIDNSYT